VRRLSGCSRRESIDTRAMRRFPRSAFDATGGLIYFPRMCDKIRLHAAGELGDEYHAFLGKGFDGRICAFLRVDYADVKSRVLAGKSDEDILSWCLGEGRGLHEIDYLVWNSFARKRGWRDEDGGSAMLEKSKSDNGLAGRDEILTMFDFYDYDEGRKS
jgi:hypothetical protein